MSPCRHGTDWLRQCARCLADWAAAYERTGPANEFTRAAMKRGPVPGATQREAPGEAWQWGDGE